MFAKPFDGETYWMSHQPATNFRSPTRSNQSSYHHKIMTAFLEKMKKCEMDAVWINNLTLASVTFLTKLAVFKLAPAWLGLLGLFYNWITRIRRWRNFTIRELILISHSCHNLIFSKKGDAECDVRDVDADKGWSLCADRDQQNGLGWPE
jgi:hypothetical protein